MFKIHYKITLFFALLTIVLMVVIYLFVLDYFQRYNYRSIQDNILKQLEIFRSVIPDSKDLNDNKYLDQMTSLVGTSLGERVTIIDRTGKVLADSEVPRDRLESVNNHSNRVEVLNAFLKGSGESRHYSQTINREMIYHAILVSNRNAPYVIRLSVPYDELTSLVGQFNSFIIGILALILVLSVLTGFAVLKQVTSPLNRMIQWAQKIASGDYSENILHFSRDEVGTLSSALNEMSADIRSKIEELNSVALRLEKMIKSLVDGIVVINQQENVVLLNDALKDFLSLDDSCVDKKYYEVIRNHNIIEFIEKTVANDQGVLRTEVQLFTDREWIFDIFGIPVFRNARIDWAMFVFHDMTGIKQLDSKRKDFVANVSHELKTPIAIIKGYSETLLNGALEDRVNSRKFLELIDTDAARLSKLVDDLLKLSGIESGQLVLELRPCSVGDLAGQTLIRFKKMASDKKIVLERSVPEALPMVLADEERVGEVLMNLVDNAVKYTPENGKITISAAEDGDHVRITVTDTGMGIPKDKLPRLFERFYRVDPGRSRKLGGTGLGLSIVKHIVQAHNGEVSVESRLGEGSSFSFTLPKA